MCGLVRSRPSTLEETLTQLEALGTEKMRAQNSKHGAGKNQFGVRRGDVQTLAKKIKTNHELARALWKTKNIDARCLAILLIKPRSLSAVEMDRMVRSVPFVEVADWLSSYGPSPSERSWESIGTTPSPRAAPHPSPRSGSTRW